LVLSPEYPISEMISVDCAKEYFPVSKRNKNEAENLRGRQGFKISDLG
jgi:hypothetical protein